MDNFIFGMQAVLNGTLVSVKQITQYQLFWGFSIGFLVSTIVHGFLISESPRQIPTILFQDKAVSFEKIHPRKEDESFSSSFFLFSKTADKVKISFLLAALLFLLIGLFAILTYWV